MKRTNPARPTTCLLLIAFALSIAAPLALANTPAGDGTPVPGGIGAREGCIAIEAWGEAYTWDWGSYTLSGRLITCPGEVFLAPFTACFLDGDGIPLDLAASEFVITVVAEDCDNEYMRRRIELLPAAPQTDEGGCMPFDLIVPECVSLCCTLVWNVQAGDCILTVELDLLTADFDQDGAVGESDAEYFWDVLMPANDLCGDFDDDWSVGMADFAIWSGYFGCDCLLTGAEAEAETPEGLRDLGNVPNPFNPRTDIRFDLPSAGPVELAVFTVAGRRIRTLVAGELSAGHHSITWDGRDENGEAVPSGIYLYRVVSESGRATNKMTLIP